MNWSDLKRLRGTFLSEGSAERADYWSSPELLADYDATFGERIAWKWRAVLAELVEINFPFSDATQVIDWGCGTARASRELLAHSPSHEILLHDRSALAVQSATSAINQAYPKNKVSPLTVPPENFGMLVSHVVTELSGPAMKDLVALAGKAKWTVWVEAGTPGHSRKLIEAREKLVPARNAWAPCPHSGPCGLLKQPDWKDWCHHFAPPAPEAFTTRHWREFSELLKIDLRSLPTSYLAISDRPRSEKSDVRLIGRARVYKGYAKTLLCEKAEVKECRLLDKENRSLDLEAFSVRLSADSLIRRGSA